MEPTIEESWETIMKKVDGIDDGMEKGWKEDIDTLLVFAGLFSAVVTAFTVESYQWLSEDPSDTAVLVLSQISRQLNGQNTVQNPPFTPSPSAVRINTFWFLSLILSLVDALLGLMCKQWLREYRRPTNTQTPDQWLALRCFRSKSFERWNAASFFAALPIILEIALFSFFAGLLELLWMRHHIPFGFAVAVIASAALLYLITTLLPGIDIIRIAFSIHPDLHDHSSDMVIEERLSNVPEVHHLCPYKSPQSWAVFRLLASIFTLYPEVSRAVISFVYDGYYKKCATRVSLDSVRALTKRLRDPGNWSSVDLDIVQHFSKISNCPDMYGLSGYRWMVQEFQDTPSMVPHLQTVLQALPPHLVMPVVFDRDIVRLDRDWSTDDVEEALRGTDSIPEWPYPTQAKGARNLFEISDLNQVRLLFYHHLWIASPLYIHGTTSPLTWNELPALSPKQRQAPLTRILELMEVGAYDIAEAYLYHIIQNDAVLYSNIEEMVRVAQSIGYCDLRSLTKPDSAGDETKQLLANFLRWFSERLIERRAFVLHAELYRFIDALDVFRVGQGLPTNYFGRVPFHFPVSLQRLGMLLQDPIKTDIAVEMIEECKRAWNAEKDAMNPGTIHPLLNHLLSFVLGSIPREARPPHLEGVLTQYGWTSPTSDQASRVMSSKGLLSLLVFCNEGRGTALNAQDSRTLHQWDCALQCVAHVNGLPLDYFESYPLDGEVSGTAEAGVQT
ncbi:hypothetical protein V5O48_006244 [Marasmius crinis-equi]|uniref:DUF6535 domain-containing protein n=1 Tax=Marasmius crinis-equi TaxID=585013 RepID=A0ABR3FK16_9AGAR